MSQKIFNNELVPLRKTLFQTAYNLMANTEDAEDATQEVYLKLWHMRESLSKYENLAAFAIIVTKNLCLDKIRTRKIHLNIETVNINEKKDENDPHKQTEYNDTESFIKKIIEQLPSLQRMIIQMKDIEEYEISEIAEIAGSTPESIRVNLSRARKKVKEEFIKWQKNDSTI